MDKLLLEELNKFRLFSGYDTSKTLSEQSLNEDRYGGKSGTPVDLRQQNTNNTFCSVNKQGLIINRGSQLNGTAWDDYVKTYKPTAAELAISAKSCPNSELAKKSVTAAPAGGTSAPAGGTSAPSGGGTKTTTPVVGKPIPMALKNSEGVKKFQQWLNTNASGWVSTGTLELNPARGYGRFGPKTAAAWDKYKNRYLNPSVKTTQTGGVDPDNAQADAENIAATTTQSQEDINVANAAKVVGTPAQINKPLPQIKTGFTPEQQANLDIMSRQFQTPEQKKAAELAKQYGRK
jgi:hypothetical protein